MHRTFPIRSLWLIATVFTVAAVLTSCDESIISTGEGSKNEEPALLSSANSKNASASVHADGELTTVASFDASGGELPEGIAVDRFGNIYVSMSGTGEIWKLEPDGSFEEIVASFALNAGDTGVLGLKFDPRGDLYAAVSSTDENMNGVWQIGPNGEKERIAGTGSIAFPNDVAISPRGTLYITDSASGSVLRYSVGGEAETWIQDESLEGTGAFGLGVPIGANGIAVTPGNKMAIARGSGHASKGGVLVANSEKGQLVYVPIEPDGSAGEPEVVISDADLFGLDGITVDSRGTIYGAVNVANAIVHISRDGSEFGEIASGEPLDFPASLTFGAGREQHTLYIANFAIIHFLSDPPTPADADPAVTSLHVGPPGRAR